MSPIPPIRLLIVDDHYIARAGLVSALNAEPGLKVVGEASNGRRAAELALEIQPDVTLMDACLPVMDGLEATRLILGQQPAARILMLSIREGEQDIAAAQQAGVLGYLPKSVEHATLLEAIRTVAKGREFYPPEIAARLEASKNRRPLSPRENQMLDHIVRGYSNKEIAASLNIADHTVRLHVSNLLDKLGVQDRTQAAAAAIKLGYVHLD
jgi:DNA-binding NarL/FixJ family response regulator